MPAAVFKAMKKLVTIVMAGIFLASIFASIFARAESQGPKETIVIGSMNPPLLPAQMEAAKKAAFPVAELYAQDGIVEFRRRGYEGWALTTRDPRMREDKLDYQVIEIGRKNGISRIAVRGLVNGLSKDGTIKWGVSSFRVLMDVGPDGRVVNGPELNHGSNLLTTDHGRWFPLNPESTHGNR